MMVERIKDTQLAPYQVLQVIKKSREAKEGSYSPYSNFRVGCCLLTKDGDYILGANVENASYGGAICAERTAIVKAVTQMHREDWICLAITSDLEDECVPPCGICRQVIREFASPSFPIIMTNSDGSKTKVMTLEELLPNSFGPDHFEHR